MMVCDAGQRKSGRLGDLPRRRRAHRPVVDGRSAAFRIILPLIRAPFEGASPHQDAAQAVMDPASDAGFSGSPRWRKPSPGSEARRVLAAAWSAFQRHEGWRLSPPGGQHGDHGGIALAVCFVLSPSHNIFPDSQRAQGYLMGLRPTLYPLIHGVSHRGPLSANIDEPVTYEDSRAMEG